MEIWLLFKDLNISTRQEQLLIYYGAILAAVLVVWISLLSVYPPLMQAFAASPAFDQIFITDEQIGNKKLIGFKLMGMTALI